MTNTAPVMIWACDAHGGYTFFNEQWVTFTGLARETLLNNPWLREVHPEDYPAYRQKFLAAFQERVDFRAEYRLRRSDGGYRWLIDTGVPMFDEAGTFLGYIGNCVDITDRKTMEDALIESERKFKRLFDLSADAQMLLDGERVVDCNPASVAMFCVSDRWAIIGRPASDFLSRPVDAPADAVVIVNGVERGRGHVRVTDLDRSARHAVRIHCPGHHAWSGSVSLDGKPAAKIRPTLKPRAR
jgi:PAS domain S-box-containing protein